MHCKTQPSKTPFSKTIQEFPTMPETERVCALDTLRTAASLKARWPAHVNRSATTSVYVTDPLGASDGDGGTPGPTLLEEEQKCHLQGPPTSVLKTEMHCFS